MSYLVFFTILLLIDKVCKKKHFFRLVDNLRIQLQNFGKLEKIVIKDLIRHNFTMITLYIRDN